MQIVKNVVRKAVRRLVIITVALIVGAAVLTTPGAAADGKIGVVLMHGKGGTAMPRSPIGPLAEALEEAGFLVVTPDMPWSRSRVLDKDYEAAMDEIDGYVKELKERGATKIVVAGHSMGANAAIGYGARRDGLAGIVAIAPGHLPEFDGFQNIIGGDYRRAKDMIDAGKGDETADFNDVNQGSASTITVTAKAYYSWFNPTGPAPIPTNIAKLRPGTPILWIVGEKDPMADRGEDYAYAKAPANPKNAYVVVKGGHKATPKKGKRQIIEWLEGL